MYDLRRLLQLEYPVCRAVVCGFGLAAFSLSSSAATNASISDPAYNKFRAVVTGNTAAVSFGTDGTALATPSPSVFRSEGVTTSSGNLVRGAQVSTKYGAVPFKVSQAFTLGNLAKGVAAVATNPLLAVGLAIASPFIADWLSDSGLAPDSTGVYGAPASGYYLSTGSYRRTSSSPISYGWSVEEVCAAWASLGEGGISYVNLVVSGTTCTAKYPYNGSLYNRSVSVVSASNPPYSCPAGSYSNGSSCSTTVPTEPVTAEQAEAALAANARTITEVENMIAEGAKLDALPAAGLAPPVITPADGATSIQSPTKTNTTTQTNPDGTTVEEVKSCWIKGEVQLGASMKMVEVCNTDTTTKAADGTVTGTSTSAVSSETADAATLEEEGGLCDSLVGKLLCAELDTPDAEPIDKTTKTISYATENHFGGGACPADAVTTLHTGQSLKVWDWATSCQKINQFFRPLFLSLCAFSALMILAPAVKEA